MEGIDFSKSNILFISNEQIDIETNEYKKENEEYDVIKIRAKLEPWLTAVFQSEHLSLIIGNGLTIALTGDNKIIGRIEFEGDYKEKIKSRADEEAKAMGRGEANFEDDLRIAIELLKGYEILEKREKAENLKTQLNQRLKDLLDKILRNENIFLNRSITEKKSYFLRNFLLSFSSRTATRDRLNIFTTNYDRFLEYGLDETGILILDRFIGKLKPIMRFHRIDLDYHYNPPGIRGEPRYVEGVVRYTKLHGSIDWRFEQDRIIKIPLPFGDISQDNIFENPFDSVVIFPNSSKAIETSYFPYSELFRDFSTAICRPNSVLVTYGYGFGDSHINRIIKDMLTIPSTHLVIISYDLANNRIKNFIEQCNPSQLTLLIGNHVADLEILSSHYLPKPAIERITDRQTKISEQFDRQIINKKVWKKNHEPF